MLPGLIWRILEEKGDNSLLLAIVSDNLCCSLEVKERKECACGSRIFCGILILLSSLVEEYFCTCPRRSYFTAPNNSVSEPRAIRSGIQAVGLYVSSCLCFSLYTFLPFLLLGTFPSFLLGLFCFVLGLDACLAC